MVPGFVVPKPFRWAGTMLVVLVCWVFFRADSLTGAVSYIASMFGSGTCVGVRQATYYIRQYWIEWLCCAVVSVPVLPWLNRCIQQKLGEHTGTIVSQAWYVLSKVGAWCIFLYAYIKLVTGSFNPFIYFHF